MVVKVATRLALAAVTLFVSVASCTYGIEAQDGKTERACVSAGLDEHCDEPR